MSPGLDPLVIRFRRCLWTMAGYRRRRRARAAGAAVASLCLAMVALSFFASLRSPSKCSTSDAATGTAAATADDNTTGGGAPIWAVHVHSHVDDSYKTHFGWRDYYEKDARCKTEIKRTNLALFVKGAVMAPPSSSSIVFLLTVRSVRPR